jgi:hypothetical protein
MIDFAAYRGGLTADGSLPSRVPIALITVYGLDSLPAGRFKSAYTSSTDRFAAGSGNILTSFRWGTPPSGGAIASVPANLGLREGDVKL